MHSRVTTVALSIAAFIATAGLVVAAAPKRYGTTQHAPVPHASTTTTTGTATVSHLPENPWFGVDVTKNKPAMTLKPRTARVKQDDITRPTGVNSRLVVKFNDDMKIRLLPDGRIMSLTGQDATAIQELLDANAVLLEPMSSLSEERIQSIINRAELHSGKAQPDVGGMFHVMGFERDVDTAARQ
ncbi:MAG: hypothetical protein MK101_12360, partial [Phycisphaerales bacterium]|nr:hypothetical protein [Phycisphaerales bacterium]